MSAPDARSAPRRRRTLLLGGCVAMLVAAVVVAIVISTSPRRARQSAPTSPTQAAQDWIDAHLQHNTSRVRALSCAGNTATEPFEITVAGAGVRAVRAGPAQRRPDGTWRVELDVVGATGQPAGVYPVHVERRGGAYLVC